METKLLYEPLDRVEADAVGVVLFEEGPGPAELNFASAWLEELRSSGEFTGKPGELAVLHHPPALKAKRLAGVGGGKREKFDGAALRKALGTAGRAPQQKGVKKPALELDGPVCTKPGPQ